MSKKTQHEHTPDDWAGLAQNLFGINLDKAGDDDLLDEDMFKVELPKPPEPPVPILQSEVEFAPEAKDMASKTSEVPGVSQPSVAKPTVKAPVKRAFVASASSDEADPFGFGVVEEA